VPGETLVGAILDNGAHVLRATVDAEARFTVECASDTDVRTLVDRVQAAFPETWLNARHERARPVRRADSISEETLTTLTDRQEEALEAAYRAGYFDWPRESTAEEVADNLGIAAPTLHAHLRKAERELLATVFTPDGVEQ